MDDRTSDDLVPIIRAVNDKVCFPHPGYRDALFAASDRVAALEAALTKMAGLYYFHPRLLDACNEILRSVGLPNFVKPTQSSPAATSEPDSKP
jgi:hypothetical protein